MATRESIEFDFRRALSQAEKIDMIADNLSRLSRAELGGVLQNVSAGWKGDNASIYLNKGSALQGKMDGTVRELYAIASDIRTIAKRLHDAEMAALEIASGREY